MNYTDYQSSRDSTECITSRTYKSILHVRFTSVTPYSTYHYRAMHVVQSAVLLS